MFPVFSLQLSQAMRPSSAKFEKLVLSHALIVHKPCIHIIDHPLPLRCRPFSKHMMIMLFEGQNTMKLKDGIADIMERFILRTIKTIVGISGNVRKGKVGEKGI